MCRREAGREGKAWSYMRAGGVVRWSYIREGRVVLEGKIGRIQGKAGSYKKVVSYEKGDWVAYKGRISRMKGKVESHKREG